MAALPPQQQGEQQKRQKVMVAVDESECSHHALEWALRNLAPVLAPPLLVLTVQPLVPLGYVSAASFGAPPPDLIKSMQEQQRQLTQALLDKAKAICAEHGLHASLNKREIPKPLENKQRFPYLVAVETIVEVGDPKEVICETAQKSYVDLLVLGSHSRGPIQSKSCRMIAKMFDSVTQQSKLFLGSVSNYCMHHSKCPVLVVKKQG